MSDEERREDDAEDEVLSTGPAGDDDLEFGGGAPVYDEDDSQEVDQSELSGSDLAESGDDVGPGSAAFEARAEELMEPYVPPQPALPGDFKENWTLLFCAVTLFVAALWLPMEGRVLDLTAKDSIAGGFLLASAACAILGCWANIAYRKMLMKPILLSGFIGLYVAVKRMIVLWSKEWPDVQASIESTLPAGEARDAAIKDARIHMMGSGTWVILLFSLLIFWTLFKSVREGRKRHLARQEADRVAKAAARKNR